jgi:hypothetical protein
MPCGWKSMMMPTIEELKSGTENTVVIDSFSGNF